MKPTLPHISPIALKLFAGYTRRFVGRRFHALRILRTALPPCHSIHPLVIYLNHASWWDPLVCLLLAREFFPRRNSYAPIDAAMLERYAVFSRLGFFGIEQGSALGGRAFVRTAGSVLASSGNALWLTPQGRFADVRERPIRFQGGLAALALRTPGTAFVPLAIEYNFWTEPRPEILVAFGDPIVPCEQSLRSRDQWTQIFSERIQIAQDELAARACAHNAKEWQTLNRGDRGISLVYDLWRRVRAGVRRELFRMEHLPEASR